jgi:hypothetical protein
MCNMCRDFKKQLLLITGCVRALLSLDQGFQDDVSNGYCHTWFLAYFPYFEARSPGKN